MGKFIVIVLDSFGVGYMADTVKVRPRDVGANTARHILENQKMLRLPVMEKLGLINAIGEEFISHVFSKEAVSGSANLAHQGADSFLGHQEIMGTTPKIPLNQPFNEKIGEVEAQLIKCGYQVRRVGEIGQPQILVINECATVGDNLETDLGQVYNVSACLDQLSFKEITKLGKAVREVVEVSRVIAFGGEQINLENLLAARKIKQEIFAGIDAPESGVYRQGYQVIHLGYGIDPEVQLPTILDHAGITVSLLGKVADIVQTSSNRLFPGVDSLLLFEQLKAEIKEIETGFICLNIQETDLAGHAEDVVGYANRLILSDQQIGEIIPLLTEEDILIVMADHGNDPTIGHSNHTRERVPLMIYRKGLSSIDVGSRETMSDVAATAAEYFGVKAPQHGVSFLDLLNN